MSEHNNDPIIDRVRDGEPTGSDLRHISTILPQVLDEEGITIYSTDEDDPPRLKPITIELAEVNFMDSPLAKDLKAHLDALKDLMDR